MQMYTMEISTENRKLRVAGSKTQPLVLEETFKIINMQPRQALLTTAGPISATSFI